MIAYTYINTASIKIIAVAGIDDAVSVAGFGIIISLMFSTGGVAFQISQGTANNNKVVKCKIQLT